MAAFNLSATAVINLKFSPLCRPLPPEITILAVPNSGLSDFISSFFRNFVKLTSSSLFPFIISAFPPVTGAGSNDVGLIVMHFFLSFVLTVANALPAYIGRKKVSSEITLIISLT